MDTNVDVKRDITEMELNRVKSPMNASKAFTTVTKRGLPVLTRERVSIVAVRMVLKATGVHVQISMNVIVESIFVQKLIPFCVRTPMAPTSAFVNQVLLGMTNIAEISTSVQRALISVRSTPYVLIILVPTAVSVKRVSEEIHGKNAQVNFV